MRQDAVPWDVTARQGKLASLEPIYRQTWPAASREFVDLRIPQIEDSMQIQIGEAELLKARNLRGFQVRVLCARVCLVAATLTVLLQHLSCACDCARGTRGTRISDNCSLASDASHWKVDS